MGGCGWVWVGVRRYGCGGQLPQRKPSNNSSDDVVLGGGMPPYIEKRSGRGVSEWHTKSLLVANP